MRRRPDLRALAAAIAVALGAMARADESFEAFAHRLGLTGTLRTWQIDRLRNGSEAVKVQAARALAGELELLSPELATDAEERAKVLREVVAALPADDATAARLRLELGRQFVAEAAGCVDRLRGDPTDRAVAERARQSITQAQQTLVPLLAAGSTRRRADPRTATHEGAELLEAWTRTLGSWLARLQRSEPQQVELELARARVQFARLVDADPEAPRVENASADLLRTEFGAESAIGLAQVLDLSGRRAEAQAWLDAVEGADPPTQAARRVPAVRLAFAIDAGDAKAMQRVLERMPARSIPASLAIAAARVAASLPGDQAQALVARSLDAMDAPTRAAWFERLAAQPGPWRGLAVAVREAQAALPSITDRSIDRAQSERLAQRLQQALAQTGPGAPGALRGEALRLQAWCERAQGREATASATFEQAAGASAVVRPESLWMAALCETGESPSARARRVDLLRRQRAIDPAGAFAGRVATWMSRLDAFPSDAMAVAVLLEVPESDAFLADARAEAARRLLAAGGQGADLRDAARRALQALEPVASRPQAARWRLAAALAADDLDTAAQAARDLPATERLDASVAAGLVRLEVMRGDLAAARTCIEALPADTRAAISLAAIDALAAMQGAERRQAAIELSLLALDVASDRTDMLQPARERLARSMLRAIDENAAPSRELATRVAARLAPGDPASRVESMALAEALRLSGRGTEAIERLQKLSAGLPQGGAPWTEARWRLFEALRDVDARRAAAMLAQHLALAPDGGAAPWGARFLQAAKAGAP